MTLRAPAPTAAVVSRFARLDPGAVVLRRAVRVSAVACLAFYPLRYLLGDPTAAVYAVFTAIALGALSDVQGRPASRTRTYLAALVAGAVLVTAGTLAAVSTAVAAAGMLVVGFVVAFAGVGGPRVVGVANGLQLFYVLPCFPPFAPDTLDQRLVGLVVGGLLLTAADRLLWPVPTPMPPGERLAEAADRLAAYAAALWPVLQDPTNAGPELATCRAALDDAAAALRLADIPPPQRPLGPGRRDRAVLAAYAAMRVTAGRLGSLADLLAEPRTPRPRTADLVRTTGAAYAELAAALRAGHPEPVATAGLDAALAGLLAVRGRRLANGVDTPADLRVGLVAMTVVEEVRLAALATGGFLGAPPPDRDATPRTLWFLHAGPIELLLRRLRVHLTPRSVYLQNAVRLAFGLAAARVIAGVLDLSHGFWVLLATLSLMRTSAIAGRAVLVRAFAGTIAGAVVAAGLLGLVGADTSVYAWALPPVMVLAFAAGPLLGVAAGQAGFTVVVAMLFAQVAAVSWRLAEVRLTDVVVGGVVGAVIGAAVWPGGGGGEVRRAAADGLRAGAVVVRDTIVQLASARAVPPINLTLPAALFDHAFVQFRTEPAGAPTPDWLVVLAVVHRVDTDASVLWARYPGGPALPADAAEALETAAAEVTAAYVAAAAAINAGERPPPGAGAELARRLVVAAPTTSAGPEVVLRLVDGWGWLEGLADDLGRLERAWDPVAPVSR